jgi:hypothetical protein
MEVFFINFYSLRKERNDLLNIKLWSSFFYPFLLCFHVKFKFKEKLIKFEKYLIV